MDINFSLGISHGKGPIQKVPTLAGGGKVLQQREQKRIWMTVR